MAEETVVHIGENSPERIAYRLLEDVARVEGRSLFALTGQDPDAADRDYILDTYSECLRAVGKLPLRKSR